MKRISLAVYVSSVLVGLVVSLVLALSTYVGGYLLLADSKGLFPSKTLFNIYEPAMRFQRWATNEPVNAGYVDSQGRRFHLQLPWPPLEDPLPPPISSLASEVNGAPDGPLSTPVAAPISAALPPRSP